MSSLKREVFEACKILQKNEMSRTIASLIKELTVSVENSQTGEYKKNKYGDFAYIAKHGKSQFQGYLYVDENVDNINKDLHFKVEHLLSNERKLLEMGHKTIISLIEKCLDEIIQLSPMVGEILNPYIDFKKVECNYNGELLLKDEEIKTIANAFKNGNLYKLLIKSKFNVFFNDLKKEQLIQLMNVISNEMKKSLRADYSADIENFYLRNIGGYKIPGDIIFSTTIILFALKESLKIICNLLYEAICGENLMVLNNKNIIKIDEQTYGKVFDKCKVIIQDTFFRVSGDVLGSILLIDCEMPGNNNLHEFGYITASNFSFSMEFGTTTSYTFLVINEEFVYINKITDYIASLGLPEFIKK